MKKVNDKVKEKKVDTQEDVLKNKKNSKVSKSKVVKKKKSERKVEDVSKNDKNVKVDVDNSFIGKELKEGKKEYIILGILGLLIIILICVLIFLNENYFNKKTYYVDYLSFDAVDYSDDNGYKISKNNDKCHILLFSKVKDEEVDLTNSGEEEKINNHNWVKQKFENGITWMTNYNNMFYIVQMYSEDEDFFDYCNRDFEKIKKTFNFSKSA